MLNRILQILCALEQLNNCSPLSSNRYLGSPALGIQMSFIASPGVGGAAWNLERVEKGTFLWGSFLKSRNSSMQGISLCVVLCNL